MSTAAIARRTFLKGAASGLVSLGLATLAGCGPHDAPATPSATKESEVTNIADSMRWWQKTIAYEIYPKSFLDTAAQGTGTIRGITERIGHLASLGVGAVWITPVYRSPMVDNGYDVQDYLDIDPSFGTMADMDDLISTAGDNGIRVVMDLVFNHTSDQCAWFQESRSSRDNARSDWYIWRDPAADGGVPTNWRSAFGGSAWEWCEERQQYYLHTFASVQPDLNWANDSVRTALFDVARFWVDKGVGGFRVDAVSYIKKPTVFENGTPDADDGMVRIHDMTANTDGILDYLNEFRRSVLEGHDIFAVGEANGVAPADLPSWVGKGGVFDMVFGFDHMHVPMGEAEEWCYPATWTLTDLKKTLTAYQTSTATNGWNPVFFENHDQPRSVNNFFPPDADPVLAAKTMAMVLLTLRGTPFIYQGEELGYANVAWPSIEDYNDVSSLSQYAFALSEGFSQADALAAVHRFSRDNARTPMQWDAGDNAGFSAVTPWLPVHDDYPTCNVETQGRDEGSVLSWYRTLTTIRAEHEELVLGDYAELLSDSEQIYAFTRSSNDRKAIVLANFSTSPASYDASLVSGATLVVSTHAVSETGVLQPLESVLYETD